MPLELLTVKDLLDFKHDLLNELKNLMKTNNGSPRLLKSYEVCRILRISPGTLQNLRRTGAIAYKKIGGTLYYEYEEVERLLGRK